MEPDSFASPQTLLLPYLFPISPGCVETPFTTTFFLSLNLLFGFFGFQCSLECFDLLHWPHITSILFLLLAFFYLVGGSSNFWYSLAFLILFSQVTIASLCLDKVSLFIPVVAIWRYGCEHVWKKVVNKLTFAWCWKKFASFNIHS